MCPIVREHTEQEMSTMIERKQEDTIGKETNCNITPFIQSNSWFNQNSTREIPIQTKWKAQRYG